MNKVLSLSLTLTTVVISGCTMVNSSAPRRQAVLASNKSAEVTDVSATGEANNYTFAVTIASPDTGCDRYADWWEIITPEGELLYRRVLLHSHVDEQPFTRTGGTVAVNSQQDIIIRVHMSDLGYSSIAHRGTVESGFTRVTLPTDYHSSLAKVEPLPTDCAF